MPKFAWNHSIPAGETWEPLTGWQYERMPGPAIIKILSSAVTAGAVETVTSGSDTLVDESPTPIFGADNVLPTEQDVEPMVDEVAAGDKIRIRYRNTVAGAVIVHGSIRF